MDNNRFQNVLMIVMMLIMLRGNIDETTSEHFSESQSPIAQLNKSDRFGLKPINAGETFTLANPVEYTSSNVAPDIGSIEYQSMFAFMKVEGSTCDVTVASGTETLYAENSGYIYTFDTPWAEYLGMYPGLEDIDSLTQLVAQLEDSENMDGGITTCIVRFTDEARSFLNLGPNFEFTLTVGREKITSESPNIIK